MARKHPWVGALWLVGLLGCVAGPPAATEPPATTEVRYPAIIRGPVPPNDEVAAARLLAEGRRAFEAGDFLQAAASARELTEEHTTVPGSSEALWILSRAALRVGDHEEAASAAASLVDILPAEHPVRGDAQTLHAEALYRSGDRIASTRAFLELPAELVTDSMLGRIADAVRTMDSSDLLGLLPDPETADVDQRAAPLLAELALVRSLDDDREGALALARRADSLGATGRADSVISAVFSEDVSGLVPVTPVIGAVLPVTGSPTNQEYAALFMEGIEVALETLARDSVPVEFAVEDNRGTLAGSERGMSALEARGAVAVLGPLLDENVAAAAQSREGRLALLSPTARTLPMETPAVYSMSSVDPGAARTLAEAVAELGFDDAVVVHPRNTERTEEALAFEESFMEMGGFVRGRFEYEPGTTYFEDILVQVDSLLPQVLVLAIPTSDIELLAPQVAFFGLDTLGVQVAGTAGWASESALAGIDRRHTDRVIAVSPSPPGLASDLTQTFVDTYETRFRKTLRSLVPPLAFDMFRLLRTSYGRGVRTAGDFVRNLEDVRQFEGVTGTYSVIDGEIVRDFFPVRIWEGRLLSIDEPLPEPPGR